MRNSLRPGGSATPAARWSGPDIAAPTSLAAKLSEASRNFVSTHGRSRSPASASEKIVSVSATRVAAAPSICSRSFFLRPRHSGPSPPLVSTTARSSQ